MPHCVHISTVHHRFDNRIFFKQCVSLAKAGHKVTLIAKGENSETVHGVQITALPKASSRVSRFLCSGFHATVTALRSNGEIFHLHDPELLPWGLLLRILTGKPVIFDMHENTSKAIRTKPWLSPWLRRPLSQIYAVIEKFALHFLRVIYAEDSYVPPKSSGVVIHNFPRTEPLEKLRTGPKHTHPALGYIGSVSLDRGFRTYIELTNLLQRAGHDISFYCVGPVRPDAQKYWNKHGRISNVHLKGFLPAEEALRVVAKCHIGLALLNPTPNYYESYPTKIFEYMALGLPFITSDFPLYKSIVEQHDCGICVDPKNLEQVLAAVISLLDNQEKAQRLGANGIQASRNYFSWDKEQGKLLGLYKNMLEA